MCATLTMTQPKVLVLTAAIDRELDGSGHTSPAMDDAGGRFYGTR